MENTNATPANDPLVNAVRDGRLVEVRWSELTADEQRQATCNYFNIYSI